MRASAPPNVVGYPLDQARAVLAQAGWDDVEAAETQPPRRGLIGPYRVLRQRISGGRVALIVSGEHTASSTVDGAGIEPATGAGDAAPASDQGGGAGTGDGRT